MSRCTSSGSPTISTDNKQARLPWSALFLGISLGCVGMHFFVTRPLMREFDSVQRQVNSLNRNVERLAGLQDQSIAMADITAALSEQAHRIDRAWRAVESFEKLSDAINIQSSRSTQTLASIDSIHESIERLGAIKAEILRQSGGLLVAERLLDRQDANIVRMSEQVDAMHRAKLRIDELAAITDEISRQSWGTEQANQTLDCLVRLKSDLIRSSHDIEFARRRADSLIEIASRLRSDQGQTAQAAEQLAKLESIRGRLSQDQDQVVSAIETLDILDRFQGEFAIRAQQIDDLRPSLAHVETIAKSVDQLVDAVQPLAELHDIRQLKDAEIRRAARAILDTRDGGSSSLLPVRGQE